MGRSGEPGAEDKLLAVVQDRSLPAVSRATALSEMTRYVSAKSLPIVQDQLKDGEPLVRLGALRALESVDPRAHAAASSNLLRDPVRGVRITAAALLAAAPADALNAEQRKTLDAGIREYIATQEINADRPEAQMSLGLLYARTGRFDQAEQHYLQALKIQSSYAPAYVNLADLYRAQQRDKEGEKLLREAVKALPDDAGVAHALGLLLVREKKGDEALSWLKRAAERAPDNARYAYVYGVALYSAGQSNRAIDVLAGAQKRHPYDRNILEALVTYHKTRGEDAKARGYADRLRLFTQGDKQP
jgi:Flp pilus assembly protein TadD